ncbi:ABC transporter permease, partial [Clostridioides difficile]|nr:ABC transporter permease [Clostridioides difficile]
MLTRKMLRDIYKNKVQFTAIFLMMFIGCFLFSGITGEWKGLERNFNNYLHNQNMADIWAFHHFTENDLEQVRNDDRITEAEGRMLLPMVPTDNREASLDTYV